MQRAMFEACSSLTCISMPNTIASWSIGPFASCRALKRLWISASTTSFSTYGVDGCYSLTKLVFPPGGTTFGTYFFSTCSSLKELILPSTTTALQGYCINNCYALPKITLPASVTTIGSSFQNAYGLKELHFQSATPPVADGSNAFKNLPTDCIIYVPTGSLSAYTTATNYPNPNTYTYVEE